MLEVHSVFLIHTIDGSATRDAFGLSDVQWGHGNVRISRWRTLAGDDPRWPVADMDSEKDVFLQVLAVPGKPYKPCSGPCCLVQLLPALYHYLAVFLQPGEAVEGLYSVYVSLFLVCGR